MCYLPLRVHCKIKMHSKKVMNNLYIINILFFLSLGVQSKMHAQKNSFFFTFGNALKNVCKNIHKGHHIQIGSFLFFIPLDYRENKQGK